MATVARDRLRTLIDAVVESLDDRVGGEELARRVYLSRFHHDRLVSAAIGESPGAFRRRLLLERAAYELSRGRRRARGRPSRRLRVRRGVRPRVSARVRLCAEPLWLERRLLDAAASLPEEKLDEPVRVEPPVLHAFPAEEPTVREMLERLIFSKETWTASLAGRDEPPRGGSSLEELRARLERSGAEFAEAVRGIRDRRAWDTAFVDAVCDPPETFTFGAMVAHVLTWSAHRRHVAIGALRSLGAEFDGTGDPIEWERRAAA